MSVATELVNGTQSRQQDELKERYMESIKLDGDYARQVLKGKERKRKSEKR